MVLFSGQFNRKIWCHSAAGEIDNGELRKYGKLNPREIKMFLSTNPHAVSKQIQMSPMSKSKAWASRNGSARWYQWSAGPSWWHNIDLRSWMMIEPRYWPTFSPLHQDITPSCRSRRHHQLDRLWLIADSSLSSGPVVNLGWPNHDVDLLDNNDYDIGSPSFIEYYEISKETNMGVLLRSYLYYLNLRGL